MQWSDVRAGDVIGHERDCLLVVSVTYEEIRVLGLDVHTNCPDTGTGILEVWNRAGDDDWESVVKSCYLILRA